MLKFQDSSGKVLFVLDDSADEPVVLDPDAMQILKDKRLKLDKDDTLVLEETTEDA